MSASRTSHDTQDDPHRELREGVRAVCRQFDSAYWQKVDEERGYPEAFVDALTQAGWLSALIPEEYGGSGLSIAEASAHIVIPAKAGIQNVLALDPGLRRGDEPSRCRS